MPISLNIASGDRRALPVSCFDQLSRVSRRRLIDCTVTPGANTCGTVKGICPVCDRMMSQRVNATRLSRFRAELDVTTRPPPEPIGES